MGTVTVSTFEQEFATTVARVTHQNADGTERQLLLKKCYPGELVELRRETNNPHDRFAIAVVSAKGEVLGYIPAGDRRLADHIDRGGQVRATILRITGGPNFFQRALGLHGKHYGCVLRIVKRDCDWKAAAPWMDANREIDRLVKAAQQMEGSEPEKSLAQYRDVIAKIKALDSNGARASAWRTVRYPIDRFSLLLDRQGMKAEALTEIAGWRQYSDPVGISEAEHQRVVKREARLSKTAGAPPTTAA